jgi:hypothetical protein
MTHLKKCGPGPSRRAGSVRTRRQAGSDEKLEIPPGEVIISTISKRRDEQRAVVTTQHPGATCWLLGARPRVSAAIAVDGCQLYPIHMLRALAAPALGRSRRGENRGGSQDARKTPRGIQTHDSLRGVTAPRQLGGNAFDKLAPRQVPTLCTCSVCVLCLSSRG